MYTLLVQHLQKLHDITECDSPQSMVLMVLIYLHTHREVLMVLIYLHTHRERHTKVLTLAPLTVNECCEMHEHVWRH